MKRIAESQAENGKDVPDLDIVNEILAKHETGYQVIDGMVTATAERAAEQASGTRAVIESPKRAVSRVAKPDLTSYGWTISATGSSGKHRDREPGIVTTRSNSIYGCAGSSSIPGTDHHFYSPIARAALLRPVVGDWLRLAVAFHR
jgi:hypothetical protein